jgi:hypothetical protein
MATPETNKTPPTEFNARVAKQGKQLLIMIPIPYRTYIKHGQLVSVKIEVLKEKEEFDQIKAGLK